MGRLGYSLGKEEIAPRYLAHINEKEKPNKCSKSGRLYCNNWFANKFCFQISIENIVLIPNSLGIITYIVGAAAGMKLIKTS